MRYWPTVRPGGLSYMGYIGMCGPKVYDFSVVLVINSVSILADFGHFGHKYGFCHSNLDMGMFLRRSHFFIIIENKINKSPSQIMFTVV